MNAVTGSFTSLDWDHAETELGEYVVQMAMSAKSWGETLTVSIGDRSVTVTSTCRMPFQVVDWGQTGET